MQAALARTGRRDKERTEGVSALRAGYYAAYFHDPDEIKLEVVYEPTRAATTSG